jgi:single-stranded-DNA-specific exonuclease
VELRKSVTGTIWQKESVDERLAKTIQQRYCCSEVLSQALSARQIALEEVENFLDPKIRTSLPNPFELSGMAEAVDHVIHAISLGKKITIFADYDVDGATSSALLKKFFASVGVTAGIYIPDRILEGYGPNCAALLNLKKTGTDLVITVDCGTVSFKPLETAKEAGLEVIVIDHHLGVTEKPAAIAVINPNLLNEKFPHKNLCAAGVAFLFAVAINKKLRENGFYQNRQEPNLLELLDLVALGTVCDVMTLSGINRSFVAQGLKIMQKRGNLGLRQLCDSAKLESSPNAYHLGFILGPRINAGGRVGKSDLGARLLSSHDEMEIFQIAEELELLNKQRKDIEAQVLDEAVNLLESGHSGFKTSDPVIFASSQGWHQGVIGIVASRLKDLYNKPVAVIAVDDEGVKGKASCRSISGIDFGAEILKARLEGLLLEGGGHTMAGGFSVEAKKIPALHEFFCKNLAENVLKLGGEKREKFLFELDLAQVNLSLLQELQKLEPFGVGNPRPKFIIRDLQKINAKPVGQGQNHVSCLFSSKSLVGFNGQLQGIFFGSRASNQPSPVAEILLDPNYKKPLSVAGTLNINSWMGVEKVQVVIEDVLL